MKYQQFFVDPSSGQLSMSRLCFGILTVAVLGFAGGLLYQKESVLAVDLLKAALFYTASLYGANSVGRFFRKPDGPAPQPIAPPDSEQDRYKEGLR